MACRVGIFAVFEMIISPGPCQSRTFEIQCDGILAKRQIFRRSSAVEQVTVNHLVTGSNPVVGANNHISQATGSHPGEKLEKSPFMGILSKNTILRSRVFVFVRNPIAGR